MQTDFTPEQHAVFQNAMRQYEETVGQHLLVIPADGTRTTTGEIEQAIKDNIAYNGTPPVVFLDYFQQLNPPLERGTDKQNADANLAALTGLYRKYDVPIFAISSMNRQGYSTPNSYTGAKESGNIEFSADLMLSLFFADNNGAPTNKKAARLSVVEGATAYRAGLEVIKQREGETDPIKRSFVFFGAYSTFQTNDTKPSEPKPEPPDVMEKAISILVFQLEELHRKTGLSRMQLI